MTQEYIVYNKLNNNEVGRTLAVSEAQAVNNVRHNVEGDVPTNDEYIAVVYDKKIVDVIENNKNQIREQINNYKQKYIFNIQRGIKLSPLITSYYNSTKWCNKIDKIYKFKKGKKNNETD